MNERFPSFKKNLENALAGGKQCCQLLIDGVGIDPCNCLQVVDQILANEQLALNA